MKYRIGKARDGKGLEAARAVRYLGYNKVNSDFALELMRSPEERQFDWRSDVTVLLAQNDKGEAVATARLQTNEDGPTLIEESAGIVVPERTAEVSRFVMLEPNDQLRGLMFKAIYMVAAAKSVKTLLAGAAREGARVMYRRLGFVPMLGEDVSLNHANRIPHQVLQLHMSAARGKHAEYLNQFHPEINLFNKDGYVQQSTTEADDQEGVRASSASVV